MQTFFFIPVKDEKYFKALKKYNPDYFVYDLEDSISNKDLKYAKDFIVNNSFCRINNVFIRLWDTYKNLVFDNIKIFTNYKNFILPKIEKEEQLSVFFNEVSERFDIKDFKFIILIESPKGIINLPRILNKFSDIIFGIGFGSHDYCSKIGVNHFYNAYAFARQLVVTYGKAYDKLCLDIASDILNNQDKFFKECLDGLSIGYDAKPILHPWQYEQIRNLNEYSSKELSNAKEMYKKFNGMIPSDISALSVNNKIIEKPHIKRLNDIISYLIKIKEI